MFLMHNDVGVDICTAQYASWESRGHPGIKSMRSSERRRCCHCLLSRIHEMLAIISPLRGKPWCLGLKVREALILLLVLLLIHRMMEVPVHFLHCSFDPWVLYGHGLLERRALHSTYDGGLLGCHLLLLKTLITLPVLWLVP